MRGILLFASNNLFRADFPSWFLGNQESTDNECKCQILYFYFSSSGSGPFSSSPFPSSKQVTFVSTNPPGPFGTSSGTALSSQPLFGGTENEPNVSGNGAEVQTTSLSMTSVSLPPVVPLLKCSEQDMKAFKADHFVLGAIPECPPPPELC